MLETHFLHPPYLILSQDRTLIFLQTLCFYHLVQNLLKKTKIWSSSLFSLKNKYACIHLCAVLPFKWSCHHFPTFSFWPLQSCSNVPLTPFFLLSICTLSPLPVCLCPSLPNMATFPVSSLLLRILQTDVLSHHLQRNLIYLDSQVRTSELTWKHFVRNWNFLPSFLFLLWCCFRTLLSPGRTLFVLNIFMIIKDTKILVM